MNRPDAFRGNPRLKRPNARINWSPELVAEYIKCRDDVIYFCEKYVKIVSIDDGLIPFLPRPYQKQILESIIHNRFTIVTLPRQSGKSTALAAAILHYIIFNDEKTVAVLANRAQTAREILTHKVQTAYEHLPKWLQHGVLEYNKGSFELENGSRVLADATKGSSIRGFSISFLLVDEAAHIDNWDQFWAGVYPTISSGKKSKVAMISTPNGMNHFYRLWTDANRPKNKGWNEFNPIRITWRDVPGRDEAWAARERLTLGEDKFIQEHECEFLGSTHTLISPTKLRALVYQEPVSQSTQLSIFLSPKKDHTYALVADVARGKGLDYSAFSVVDVTRKPYKQAARYRDNMVDPISYARAIYETGKKYNEATVLIENNDLGAQVLDCLHQDFEYESLIWTSGAKSKYGRKMISLGERGSELGLKTTKFTKNLGCSMLKELIEKDYLTINDFETIGELSTFAKSPRLIGCTYEAESGCHDDIVMGLVLFGWLSDQDYFKALTDYDVRQRLSEDSQKRIEDEVLPAGFFSDGLASEDDYSPGRGF